MQSWEFIDPKLAQKYSELINQIESLKHQRQNIRSSANITQKVKQKLLKYNDECLHNTSSMLHKQKEFMTQYFDKQINVLTKQEIKDEECWENCIDRNSHGIKVKKNRKSNLSNITKENCDHNETMSTFLNKTRLINQSQADISTKSGQLMTKTSRHPTKTNYHLINPKPDDNKTPNRAYRNKKTINRLKTMCKIYKNKSQFYQLANELQEQELKNFENQKEEQQQLISLLRQKVSALERQNKKQHTQHLQQIYHIKDQYNQKIATITENYEQLGRMREGNQALAIKRKQLLRQIGSQ